jgi:hypothetical protein
MGKPLKNYRAGQVQATIWENEGTNGNYNTISFKRSYKDKDGKWVDVQSFRTNDLSDLCLLAEHIERELKLRVIEQEFKQKPVEEAKASSRLVVKDLGVVE